MDLFVKDSGWVFCNSPKDVVPQSPFDKFKPKGKKLTKSLVVFTKEISPPVGIVS